MKRQVLDIPLGYSVLEETRRFSFEDARRILLTKKQKKYSRAEKYDYSIYLTSHYVACPFCGDKTPAYAGSINRIFGCSIPDGSKRVCDDIVYRFTASQRSVFDDECAVLELNDAVDITQPLVCPKCRNLMMYDIGKRRIEITSGNNRISLRCEVLDAGELMSVPCVSEEIRLDFPFYETACFDFSDGHTYLGLEGAGGKQLFCVDATYDKGIWSSGILYDSIVRNKYVKRTLRRAFNEQWEKEIPFSAAEFGVNEMRLVTRFVGYDRSFYTAIPFYGQDFRIDESFGDIERHMRFSSKAHLVYNNSSLPQMKSIRRMFFENAGLLFYVKECEELWKIFRSPDYFRSFLGLSNIFEILSDLHIRPGVFEFFKEYRREMGEIYLLKLFRDVWGSVLRYAINYESLTESMREYEREKWGKNKMLYPVNIHPRYATPMPVPDGRISNCYIDGYEFYWLKTSGDYLEASRALNNCLAGWSIRYRPVVCVRQNGKIVGAIEVGEDYINQAFTVDNFSFEVNPPLNCAFKKWKKKNRISEIYDDEEDEDDGDFDFTA